MLQNQSGMWGICRYVLQETPGFGEWPFASVRRLQHIEHAIFYHSSTFSHHLDREDKKLCAIKTLSLPACTPAVVGMLMWGQCHFEQLSCMALRQMSKTICLMTKTLLIFILLLSLGGAKCFIASPAPPPHPTPPE